MTRITVLYPASPDGRFDFDYYLNVHIPLSIERLGALVSKVRVEKGVSALDPEEPSPFIAICQMTCDSYPMLADALKQHEEELLADMRNYTNIAPIFVVSELSHQYQ
ncbi:MAG: EthD family reductase [Hyphomonadaceae bacterium]|nr:EthD family reductase [Hyphomonadaceae bacterium]